MALRWRWLTIVYWLLLTVGVLHPSGGRLSGLAPGAMADWPQLSHLLAFLVLAVVIHMSFGRARFFRLTMLMLAYAVTAEVAQLLIPVRSADILDGAANAVGIVAGSLVAVYWRLSLATGLRGNRL